MKKLYVLLRSDLDRTYAGVQGAHAVANFVYCHPDSEWGNGYLIFLRYGDEQSLKDELVRIIKTTTNKVAWFNEPDVNDEMTAIAVYTEGEEYRKFNLL